MCPLCNMSTNIAFLCTVLLNFSAKLGVRFIEVMKLKSYRDAIDNLKNES